MRFSESENFFGISPSKNVKIRHSGWTIMSRYRFYLFAFTSKVGPNDNMAPPSLAKGGAMAPVAPPPAAASGPLYPTFPYTWYMSRLYSFKDDPRTAQPILSCSRACLLYISRNISCFDYFVYPPIWIESPVHKKWKWVRDPISQVKLRTWQHRTRWFLMLRQTTEQWYSAEHFYW